jgi:hypothetical protein
MKKLFKSALIAGIIASVVKVISDLKAKNNKKTTQE